VDKRVSVSSSTGGSSRLVAFKFGIQDKRYRQRSRGQHASAVRSVKQMLAEFANWLTTLEAPKLQSSPTVSTTTLSKQDSNLPSSARETQSRNVAGKKPEKAEPEMTYMEQAHLQLREDRRQGIIDTKPHVN
jgi:hypothetical protein